MDKFDLPYLAPQLAEHQFTDPHVEAERKRQEGIIAGEILALLAAEDSGTLSSDVSYLN